MPEASSAARQAAAAARLEALRSRLERAWQDAVAANARAREIWERLEDTARLGSPGQLTISAVARLRARLATMPVIEQAKGVLMAQYSCDADQAFELLRRASQRANLPVRELAGQIVKNTQQGRPGSAPAVTGAGPSAVMDSSAGPAPVGGRPGRGAGRGLADR